MIQREAPAYLAPSWKILRVWRPLNDRKRPLREPFLLVTCHEKFQKNPKVLLLEIKSKKNPHCFRKSQDLGINSQGWQHCKSFLFDSSYATAFEGVLKAG